MTVLISVPETRSWAEQTIELSEVSYRFIYTVNERYDTPRMYLDLYLGDSLIKGSIKLMTNKDLTSHYSLLDFPDGQLFLLKLDDINNEPTLGSIGIDKSFELIYYTNEELEELGI